MACCRFDGSTPSSANSRSSPSSDLQLLGLHGLGAGEHLLLERSGGYWMTDWQTEGIKTDPQMYFRSGVIPVP